jgi:hypothetical protein
MWHFFTTEFINGLNVSEIRTKLLQEREVESFKEIVGSATEIEVSKIESAMISQSNQGQTVIEWISKNQFNIIIKVTNLVQKFTSSYHHK